MKESLSLVSLSLSAWRVRLNVTLVIPHSTESAWAVIVKVDGASWSTLIDPIKLPVCVTCVRLMSTVWMYEMIAVMFMMALRCVLTLFTTFCFLSHIFEMLKSALASKFERTGFNEVQSAQLLVTFSHDNCSHIHVRVYLDYTVVWLYIKCVW